MMHFWLILIGTVLAVVGGVWEVARKVSAARHVPEASQWHGPFDFGGAWRRHELAKGRSGGHSHTPMVVFLVGMGLIVVAVVRANF